MPSGIFALHADDVPTATAHNAAIFATAKKDMVFMHGIILKKPAGRKGVRILLVLCSYAIDFLLLVFLVFLTAIFVLRLFATWQMALRLPQKA